MPNIDRITIDPEIFSFAPLYRRVVILAEVDELVAAPEVADAFRQAQTTAQIAVGRVAGEIEDLGQIAAWRRAFQAAGLPSKYLPSVEALLRRTIDGPLHPISPLVDAGTAVSLQHLVPVGMHVLDEVSGALELRVSQGGETMETLSGQVERTKAGEVVWACGTTILARRWAWRQGRIGSVAPASRCLAVNVDLIDGVDAGAVEAMQRLLKSCGATVLQTIALDRDTPSVTTASPGAVEPIKDPLLADLERRGLIANCTNLQTLDLRMRHGRITFYVGIDPTAPSLHVGSLLVLSVVRRFQRAGHQPIIVIGGATGFIGDPSGRRSERTMLSVEVLDANSAALRDQLSRLLRPEPGSCSPIVVDNRDWLGTISCLEFLRETGREFRVGELLAKDSVRSRLDGDGLSFTEFSYSLLQAEDFAHLQERLGCDLQVGGSDQWGNIVSGIDLIRRRGRGEALGLVWPLFTRSDGEKFGKSGGDNIWLDSDQTSPWKFWQFWVNVADADVSSLLRRFSLRDLPDVEALLDLHDETPERRIAQRALADELTGWVHGPEVLPLLHQVSLLLFGGQPADLDDPDVLALLAGEIPTVELRDVEELDVASVALAAGVAKSRGEVSRLIDGGALRVNGIRPKGPHDKIKPSRSGVYLIKRGRHSHHLVVAPAVAIVERPCVGK